MSKTKFPKTLSVIENGHDCYTHSGNSSTADVLSMNLHVPQWVGIYKLVETKLMVCEEYLRASEVDESENS